MSDPREPDETIPREKVEQLVENLKSSADDLLDQLAADDIRIEPLLELTRFMARSARRISRRANWPLGDPAPGNEAPRRSSRPPSASAAASGRRDKPRRGGGGRGLGRGGERGGSGRAGGYSRGR